jgi:hypothetical protein
MIGLVIFPPTVVGVDARLRGLPSKRVSVVVAKDLLLMLVVCVLAFTVALSLGLPDALGGTPARSRSVHSQTNGIPRIPLPNNPDKPLPSARISSDICPGIDTCRTTVG